MTVQLGVIRGDITTQRVDAIVNAANTSLMGGGGVDGAIHRAAGKELLAACTLLGGCMTGDAKITPGFRLPARFVIHTVGPVYRDGKHGESELLASCYKKSLDVAALYNIKTIAFPSISTGAYGYPVAKAATIAVQAVRTWITEHDDTFSEIRFVVYSDEAERYYRELLTQV